ncbi:hypothetical protein ACV1DN_09760 [Aeromonas allosaccharophila]
MLGRETSWRQGCVLTTEAACILGLIDDTNKDKLVIVISHDCDLASEELTFEVIVGSVIGEANKVFRSARNPRKLHLNYIDNSMANVSVELTHSEKIVIQRDKLSEQCKLNTVLVLPDDEKRTLKQWLAARYGRPAFPNTFENHLRKPTVKRKTVEKEIAEILAGETDHLVGLFFDLEDFRHNEPPTGESYPLNIYVVYDTIKSGGEPGRLQAVAIANSLTDLFHRAYGLPEEATEIALGTCKERADVMFSIADLRRMDQWRLEYISLGAGDDIIAADELNY